jgi:predicted enzyme related to lactoylglutathione lyase
MEDKLNFGQFCWNELATANVQAAKDFYGKVFNWKFQDHDMGDMTYTMINNGNAERGFGGIWAIPKDKQKEIPPHWIGYILVENLDKSLEQVKTAGGNIMKPAADAGNMGRFAIITDPTGAHIALWQILEKK